MKDAVAASSRHYDSDRLPRAGRAAVLNPMKRCGDYLLPRKLRGGHALAVLVPLELYSVSYNFPKDVLVGSSARAKTRAE
jgi:hypothetical protein